MKRIGLKRWRLVAAMAAMVLVVAIPALADTSTSQKVTTDGVSQNSDGEAESGEFDQTFEVSDSGGSSGSNNQAPATLPPWRAVHTFSSLILMLTTSASRT